MTKSITPTQIKKNNRSLIYHYLYQHPGSSQQELALQLHLSRPTVASNLSLLESEGRISKSGQIASESAGRKAAAYAIVPDFRIALGVELLKNEVKVVAVNLYGKSIARDSFSETYTDTPEYYQMICDKILIFARALPCESSQILGIGFAMQALISADKKAFSTERSSPVPGCHCLFFPIIFRGHAPSSMTRKALPSPSFGPLRISRMPFISRSAVI